MEHPPSDTVPPSPLCGIDACPGVALPQAQPPGQVDLGEQAPPLTTLLTNHYEAQIGAEWPPSAEPPHYRPDFLRASMPEDAEGPQCSPPSNGGCRGGSTHSCGGPVFSHDDYKDKYPEDTIGGECGHSARVWRMFYDEARVYDVQMAGNHRENLDVVIVVSGFFSVVVALFLTQASQKLDVNYGQMTSLMVFEMVQLQRAALTGASDSSIPVSPINPDTPFIPSTSIIWVNNLWFTSLALSLATAFLAVLAKHWIHHYMSLTSGTARDMARLRQSRFIAFMKWHVSLIINLLPAALNISFTIFSVGLVVFALNKECSAGYAVAAICVVAFLAYVAAIVMPTIDPQTPYATPLSEAFYALYHSCVGSLLDLGTKWNIIKFIDSKQKKQYSTALQALELERVQKETTQLDPQALHWLYSESTKNSVHEIIIEAIGGLSPQINSSFLKSLFIDSGIWKEREALLKKSLVVLSDDNIQQRPLAGLGNSVERLVRFKCQLDMSDTSKEKQKVVILPEDWEPGQKYTNQQVEMMATVACAGQDEPRPSGYLTIGQILNIVSAASELTLPAYVWTTLFDRALKEKGPTLFPVTTKDLSTYEIFLHNIVINTSRCKGLWDSNNHVELDETLCGFTIKDALSAGLFQHVGSHILTSFAPFDTYQEESGSSASYAVHLRIIICLLNYLMRKALPETFRNSQARGGSRSPEGSHSSYVLLSNDSSVEHTVVVVPDSSSCTTEEQLASPFIDHPTLCQNCLLLLFEVLQDFHIGVSASKHGASKRDREIMTDLMGRLINSAVFTGPIWLPVANIPASVQADDVDMIKSLADIRQRVIASSASILKHRNLPGWGLHRKGEWIVTMMRLFFDRDLVCDNLAWYCQVYDMESFLSTFRHMSLILEYTWADGAERHTCDAFVAMDIIGLIRDSQLLWVDWMRLLYRFVSGISTSALAEAPEESDGPRAPTKCQLDGYVDYLYQPNNLLTVCLSLSALFANAQLTDDNESEMGLLRLMRMRPDDPAWPDCIARMQAFATQNDPTAMRVDRDTYLCVHTFQLQTYTAEQVSEIETRVRKYAGILQGWLNDGLPAAEEPPPGQVARCIAEASDATKIDDCDSETDKDKRQSIFSIFRRFKFSPRRQSVSTWNTARTEEEEVGVQA